MNGKLKEDQLKQRFTRARLKAILDHDLREAGHHEAASHVEIVPRMGYLVAIGHGEALTIRLVEEYA
jgi:hypothetical protein